MCPYNKKKMIIILQPFSKSLVHQIYFKKGTTLYFYYTYRFYIYQNGKLHVCCFFLLSCYVKLKTWN